MGHIFNVPNLTGTERAIGEPESLLHRICRTYCHGFLGQKITIFSTSFAVSLVLCLFMFSPVSFAQDGTSRVDKLFENDVPPGAKDVAQKRLMPFLNAIPDQYLRNYNFKSRQETALAGLGEPHQLYTIHPDKIINYDGKASIVDMVSPTGEWYFPVVLKKEIRTTFMVAFINGKWEAVDLGGNLAGSWAAVMKEWPGSKGYRHLFVRVFQAASDFAVLSKSGKITIMPLESAAHSLGMERGQAIETSTMVTRLKQPVLDNVKSFNNPKRGLVK